MTTPHKLFEELYKEPFTLIAIHSNLEDHALVYSINNRLKCKLQRAKEDLDISSNISFPIFEWYDPVGDRLWTLCANRSIYDKPMETGGLFENEASKTNHHLVSEYKDVDYFLKIDQDITKAEKVQYKTMLNTTGITLAYFLDTNKIKSKSNLIF